MSRSFAARRRRHRLHGRHGVLLVQCGPDFRPSHWHTFPDAMLSAEWYRRKLHLHDAHAIVRAFNCAALPCVNAGTFNGRWLLLTTNARSTERHVRNGSRLLALQGKLQSDPASAHTAEAFGVWLDRIGVDPQTRERFVRDVRLMLRRRRKLAHSSVNGNGGAE